MVDELEQRFPKPRLSLEPVEGEVLGLEHWTEGELFLDVVNVALGTVRFVVTKGKAKGSSFKVVTPTAVAGVRGTEFIVTVGKNGETSFIGISGSIETAPLLANGKLGTKSIVAKGQVQDISKNALASKVKSNKGNGKINNGKNKGKGKKSNKLAKKGINRGKAQKTTRSKFLTKKAVERPRIKVAKLSTGPKPSRPSFKVQTRKISTKKPQVIKKLVRKAVKKQRQARAGNRLSTTTTKFKNAIGGGSKGGGSKGGGSKGKGKKK